MADPRQRPPHSAPTDSPVALRRACSLRWVRDTLDNVRCPTRCDTHTGTLDYQIFPRERGLAGCPLDSEQCLIMVALCNRGRPLYFCAAISIFLFSSPNLSGQRLDVYRTSTHGVALVRI